jgi:hypothetical protein
VFTENGVMIDLEELRKVVESCDVFTVGFRLFPQRVLVDTRSTDAEGPMIEIVEPVNTIEERFFWLGQRRPSFGVPERFTFFIWPHSISYLEESGVMDQIRKRIYPQDPERGRQVAHVLYQLHVMEQQAVQDAISGKNYHTLWERESATG